MLTCQQQLLTRRCSVAQRSATGEKEEGNRSCPFVGRSLALRKEIGISRGRSWSAYSML